MPFLALGLWACTASAALSGRVQPGAKALDEPLEIFLLPHAHCDVGWVFVLACMRKSASFLAPTLASRHGAHQHGSCHTIQKGPTHCMHRHPHFAYSPMLLPLQPPAAVTILDAKRRSFLARCVAQLAARRRTRRNERDRNQTPVLCAATRQTFTVALVHHCMDADGRMHCSSTHSPHHLF
jgi:hypothetical protein